MNFSSQAIVQERVYKLRKLIGSFDVSFNPFVRFILTIMISYGTFTMMGYRCKLVVSDFVDPETNGYTLYLAAP